MGEPYQQARAVIWRTLADHQWRDWACSCGQVDPAAREYEDNHLADQIAAALAADGLLRAAAREEH